MFTVGRGLIRAVTVLAYLAGVVWFVLMLLTVYDIVRRGAGITSFLAVSEMTEVMQVIPIFLGLAYAEYTGANVRTGLLTSRLSPRAGAIVRGVAMAGVVGVIALLSAGLVQRAIEATITGEFRFGQGSVLVWPSRIAAAIGAFALLLVCVLRLADFVRAAIRADSRPYLPEPEQDGVHV